MSRVLVFGGKDDDAGIPVAQLEQYQEGAAKAGVPVTLVIQDGAQHIVRSIATERERTRQFARFLLEN
jgi:dipeptidyl aminopeptidase/acylaminoacyl peptidase